LDLLKVRSPLEPAATALAAVRMSDDDRVALGQLLSTVDMDTELDELVAWDLEFHRQIAAGAGNLVLASLVDNISTPTTRVRVWRGMTEPSVLARTFAEHRAIDNAIVARDADMARSFATVHIGGVEPWLRTALVSQPSGR
jgi:DNA-binding FadR family transcriptional regulator